MEHYCNFTFYIPETGGTRHSATAQFFPHYVKMPRITNVDAITIAVDDLLQALQNKNVTNGNLQLTQEHYGALKQMAKIFNTASKKPIMILKPPLPPIIQEKQMESKVPVAKETILIVLKKAQTREKEQPTIIPLDTDDNSKFSRFIPRPATHHYNTRNKAAPHIIPVCNNVVDDKRKKMSYRKLIKSAVRQKWVDGMIKELGRISQGYKNVTKGTNTVEFMSKEEVAKIPKHKIITYARITVDYRKEKKDPYRIRITVGGNLIKYPRLTTSTTADITTLKLLWNSVISTPESKFIALDVKNYYLQTPLKDPEYMRIH